MPVSKELIEILACPRCKGDIKYDQRAEKIICNKCRLKFPVLEKTIPDMLIADAEKF